MAFPNIKNFGIVENPLIDSPFVQTNENGGNSPPPAGNLFLLSDGSDLLLSDGSKLLLS